MKIKEEFEELMKDVEPYKEEDPTIIKLDAIQKRTEQIEEIKKYKMLLWLSFICNIFGFIFIFSKIFKF